MSARVPSYSSSSLLGSHLTTRVFSLEQVSAQLASSRLCRQGSRVLRWKSSHVPYPAGPGNCLVLLYCTYTTTRARAKVIATPTHASWRRRLWRRCLAGWAGWAAGLGVVGRWLAAGGGVAVTGGTGMSVVVVGWLVGWLVLHGDFSMRVQEERGAECSIVSFMFEHSYSWQGRQIMGSESPDSRDRKGHTISIVIVKRRRSSSTSKNPASTRSFFPLPPSSDIYHPPSTVSSSPQKEFLSSLSTKCPQPPLYHPIPYQLLSLLPTNTPYSQSHSHHCLHPSTPSALAATNAQSPKTSKTTQIKISKDFVQRHRNPPRIPPIFPHP